MSGQTSPTFEQLVHAIADAFEMGDSHAAHAAVVRYLEETGGDQSTVSLADIQFRVAVNADGDRAAALYTAAYLDTKLEALLRTFFVEDDQIAKNLLTGTGGLANFSARIDAAFLLGLMSKIEHRDLHLIRKIRNHFAHHPEQIDFGSEGIKDRCLSLRAPESNKPRDRFIRCSVMLLGGINSWIHLMNKGLRPRSTENPPPAPPSAANQRAMDILKRYEARKQGDTGQL